MESSSSELRVWSSSNVFLNTSRDFGTTAWADASGQLYCGGSTTPLLSFGTNVAIEVGPSYANKKLSLHGKVTEVSVTVLQLDHHMASEEFEKIHTFLENAVKTLGVPTVITVLETEITRLLDKQGVNLFDIYNPEVIPQDGYVVIQMDFGFPHHLLVEFLRKTLE